MGNLRIYSTPQELLSKNLGEEAGNEQLIAEIVEALRAKQAKDTVVISSTIRQACGGHLPPSANMGEITTELPKLLNGSCYSPF